MTKHIFIRLFAVMAFLSVGIFPAIAQDEKAAAAVANEKHVLWEPADIASRNLFLGPGGAEWQPKLKGSTFIGHSPGGNNLKYRLKDGNDREWVAKIADESQPEVAAVRLLWALGYKTEINYLAERVSLGTVGRFKNVRLEARPENIKREGPWSWTSNPFVDTNEFNGLKIMMALFNNWDLKDENNVVFKKDGELHYVISDLGASFGKLAEKSGSRSGRSVNKPEHYAQSNFIKGVNGGVIEFDYKGQADHLIKGITVENGRWLADMLLQLSDKQIDDAFRAANYDAEDIALLRDAFKSRVAELDRASKAGVAANQ